MGINRKRRCNLENKGYKTGKRQREFSESQGRAAVQGPTEQRVKFGAVQKGLQEGFLQKK